MALHPKAKEIGKHVGYEFWMFNESVRRLDREPRQPGYFEHCVVLESALLHGRVLYEFLFKKINPKYPNDVRAQHFFDDPRQWKARADQFPFPPGFSPVRLDRALAH